MSIVCWKGLHKPNRLNEVCRITNKFKMSYFGVLEKKLYFNKIMHLQSRLGAEWK